VRSLHNVCFSIEDCKLGGKSKCGSTTSVYLPPEWSEYTKICKERLGISASQRLSEYLIKDLAELRGESPNSQFNIAELELRLKQNIVQGRKLQQYLEKQGTLDDLIIQADKFQLNFETLSNVNDVVLKFLDYNPKANDRFNNNDIEFYIEYLFLAREKLLKQTTLNNARRAKISSLKSVPSESTVPNVPAKETPMPVIPLPLDAVAQIPAPYQDGKLVVAPTLPVEVSEIEAKRSAKVDIANQFLPEPVYVFKHGKPEIKLLSNTEITEFKRLTRKPDEDDEIEEENT
jgi:hypothetical protein